MDVKIKNNVKAQFEYTGRWDLGERAGHFYNNLIDYLNEKAINIHRFNKFEPPVYDGLSYKRVNIYFINDCLIDVKASSRSTFNFMDEVCVSAYSRDSKKVINNLSKISKQKCN